jgi:predicted ester cyclase
MFRAFLAYVLLVGLSIGAPATGRTFDPKASASPVRVFYSEVINDGRLERLDQVISPDYVQHSEGLLPGRDGVCAFVKLIRTAVPDLRTDIEQEVVEGDRVVVFVRFSGTNTGSFMGKPPSGKPVSFRVAELFRVKQGKLVEHWGVADMAVFMQTVAPQ